MTSPTRDCKAQPVAAGRLKSQRPRVLDTCGSTPETASPPLTSAYVSIRQHTSVSPEVTTGTQGGLRMRLEHTAYRDYRTQGAVAVC
jgi:hypothetical protein